MFVKVISGSYFGVDPFLVEVEVDTTNGLPIFIIVGLGDTIISESKDRIRGAIKNSGYFMEPKRIVVNLTPANLRKNGSNFDLPIGIGVMVGMKFIKDYRDILKRYMFIGELSLTGEIRRTQGVISAVLLAKEMGFEGIVIPKSNYKEASIIKGIKIIPLENLKEVVTFIEREEYPLVEIEEEKIKETFKIDYGDIHGQLLGKRALEICAAGGHNVILIGSPGSGKTMLSKGIMSILPPMEEKEIIETTKIYSIAGELNEDKNIINMRPFRSPHNSSTVSSIIGGGKNPRPGEISLATNGILFMDEFTEFTRETIEALREPLEEKRISITRSTGKVEFPAHFIFIAACNPCPCGYGFDEDRCICNNYDIRRYQKKISGPIIDRIDLYVEVKRLTEEEMLNDKIQESSDEVRERVEKARSIQRERYGIGKLNGDMDNKDIKIYCNLDLECQRIVKGAIKSLNLSMRSYNKILKVARTIADLEGQKSITKENILEAIAFRKK
ncbi:YifB family Mg chelatase-like AAA ATPase [Cetobacterium sp. SF1]|uniref:YifB family Mg chelatase-like AAA ATPase n=1 Tax=unclassified Cetobacterium TaxID=2630983 RepID=UPI003CE922EC